MKSPQDMIAAVSASMRGRTGRTVDEWVAMVDASTIDPLDQKAVRRWLEGEHGVPQNSRWAIADAAARAAGWKRPTAAAYVDGQYADAKERLRPIFEHVRQIVVAFGDDVRIEGRATYTPFVRHRQFAAVAPATPDRVDVGLRYTDPPTSGLLTAGRAPGQGTHVLSLASVDDVTGEVERLLRAAYDQNG